MKKQLQTNLNMVIYYAIIVDQLNTDYQTVPKKNQLKKMELVYKYINIKIYDKYLTNINIMKIKYEQLMNYLMLLASFANNKAIFQEIAL